MANPNPKPGKVFVKGQVANPLGAGAHNKDVKAIKSLTREQLAEIGSHIVMGNVEKLREIIRDQESSALKVLICSAIIKGIQSGNFMVMDAILNRVVGKVKDELEVKLPRPTIIEHLNGDKTVLGSEMPEDE